jgi:signal transduction histidine kinase
MRARAIFANFRNLLEKIIEVKDGDPDDARRRRLFNIILLGTFALSLFSGLLIFLIELFYSEQLGIQKGENTALYLWLAAAICGYIFFYWLNRKLRRGEAGFMFLLFLLVAFAFSDSPEELIDGRSLYTFIMPIMLASVLVRPSFSFIFAGLTILELNLLALSANLVPQPLPYFAFLFFALLSWLSASAMENAIREQRELNLELDLRVAERTQDLLEANNKLQREIAERQQAEETVRQYADIVNTMQVGLLIVQAEDPNNLSSLRVTAANPAALRFSGPASKKIIGQPVSKISKIFGTNTLAEKCLAAIRSGTPNDIETVSRNSDGEISEAFGLKIIPLTSHSAGILFENETPKKLVEEHLRLFNTQLEERVQQRTAELETANRELEAFSYTVSHDLRAPLRAIGGYAHILLDDFSENLPPLGQSFLGKIITGTNQMGALIDGLLTFSRTSRADINRQKINTCQLVSEAWQTASTSIPHRPVEFTCADLPPCDADYILLRQVFVNLFSNAIKYSRESRPAQIEVNYTQANGETIYYVRDNGVGFDMRFAHKLFGVFQRLHRPEEFEGTGIGLAIAQRIIQRHNGKIWAESQPGQGATFYFTLGQPDQPSPASDEPKTARLASEKASS